MNTALTIPTELQGRIETLACSAREVSHRAMSAGRRASVILRIKQLLKQEDAVLVAHYYVASELQDLAEETGGYVGDSLEMARFGYEHPAGTVVVAGVRFMGETAKILSPSKRVLVVEKEAECSLDIACPADEFNAFCDQHPARKIVVYANTSAAVKARADWVVTSSIAKKLIQHLHDQGEKLIWAPDKYLGEYVQRQTGADMLLWQGSCMVHEEFKASELENLREQYPEAPVLAHPESPPAVIAQADVVGSTTHIIKAAQRMPNQTFIIATEKGIFHKMKQAAPGKTFISAPTAGAGATCKSCAHCPWMKMNDLQRLADVLESGANEVLIDEQIRVRAEVSLKRMVNFAQTHINPKMKVTGNA